MYPLKIEVIVSDLGGHEPLFVLTEAMRTIEEAGGTVGKHRHRKVGADGRSYVFEVTGPSPDFEAYVSTRLRGMTGVPPLDVITWRLRRSAPTD